MRLIVVKDRMTMMALYSDPKALAQRKLSNKIKKEQTVIAVSDNVGSEKECEN